MNLDDLIARLGALSMADRDWLLEALSPAAREQLLQLTRSERAPTDGSPAPAVAARVAAAEPALEQRSLAGLIARLAATPVSVLADVLGAEPTWFTAALLRVADWPWRAELLDRLPHVAVCLCPPLEAPSTALSEPLTRALLERVAARAADLPERGASRFEGLVQKLAARRRRVVWHR